jgi:hypothetical protein
MVDLAGANNPRSFVGTARADPYAALPTKSARIGRCCSPRVVRGSQDVDGATQQIHAE